MGNESSLFFCPRIPEEDVTEISVAFVIQTSEGSDHNIRRF
jgi:hypothetical protein